MRTHTGWDLTFREAGRMRRDRGNKRIKKNKLWKTKAIENATGT
jgi:hypothetical protein